MCDDKKEILGYIKSIILTLIFLVIGTLLWQRLHNTYIGLDDKIVRMHQVALKSDDLLVSNLEKVSDDEYYYLRTYTITINNIQEKTKNYSIKLVDNYFDEFDNTNLDNKYLHYVICRDKCNYTSVKTLSNTGIMFQDELKGMSSVSYNFKVWVSSDYSNNYNYHGNIVIEEI